MAFGPTKSSVSWCLMLSFHFLSLGLPLKAAGGITRVKRNDPSVLFRRNDEKVPNSVFYKHNSVSTFLEGDASNKFGGRLLSEDQSHGSEDGNHEAEGDDEFEWEWAGSFYLEPGQYTWTIENVDGVYAFESLKMGIISTEVSDEEGIDLVAEKAELMMDFDDRSHGSMLSPDIAYNLLVDDSRDITYFNVNITEIGTYVFFTEHLPSEFGSDHFLKDSQGSHVGQTAEIEGHHDDDHDPKEKPWGKVILATLLVNFVSLVAVVILTISLMKVSSNEGFISTCKTFIKPQKPGMIRERKSSPYGNAITSVSCGALLATVAFLIIPEAMELLNGGHAEEDDSDHSGHRLLAEEEHSEESEVGWMFGTALVGGFLFPFIIGSFFTHSHDIEMHPVKEEVCVDKAVAISTEEALAPQEREEKASDLEAHTEKYPLVNKSLVVSILVGDFFHNFADGIFIGTAFLVCSNSMGYAVVASTIYHEFAQEMADYFLLTEHGGLSPLKALALNFIAGLSVTLGGLFILSMNISSVGIGVMLTVSAGVFLNIISSECVPRMQVGSNTLKTKLISLASFCLGVVPIGLVLLNHPHCEV